MPPADSLRDAARDRVFRYIAQQCRRYPYLGITPIDTTGLSPLDAAFSHALAEAVVRRWLTLAALLQLGLNRPLEELQPKVQAALFVGAGQMCFMDKVPVWSAVDESVEWVKEAVRPGAGGLVNAALRRLGELLTIEGETRVRRSSYSDGRDEIPLADGGALVLNREVLPEDPIERSAQATSHPRTLLEMWSHSMPLRDVRRMALHGVAHPPVILNTAFATSPIPTELATPHDSPGHHVFRGDRAELLELLVAREDIWVQDPASSLAIESVMDLNPKVIIDACAGQGTKTRQFAWAFQNAKIIATDIDDSRRERLANAFSGEGNVTVIPPAELDLWAGKADLILLDVPCSNTGVLARRVEARYRDTEESVQQLIDAQRQILADSIRLLAPRAGLQDGGILYSSCSLDPRENEDHLEWAEKWHQLQATRTHRRMPSGGPGEPAQRYSDGSFAALLR